MTSDVENLANQLTVQQLRSFCYVFERQSYAAAARDLNLAVPTVWEHLKGLEQRYGAKFFVRQGRRIVPNAAAERLHTVLQPMLTGLDSTFDLISDPEGPTNLTLACGMRMLWEDLGKPLQQFHEKHPAVKLRLLHADLYAAQQLIVEGNADLALTLEADPKQFHDQVTHAEAYWNDYLAVFPKRHPLGNKSRLRLKDLVSYPLILGHPGTSSRQAFDQAMHRAGLSRHVQVCIETDNAVFTVFCAQAGLGVGIIAGRMGQSLTKGLVTRRLGSDLGKGRIVFLWKKGKHLSSSLLQFMNLVRESAQDRE